MAAASKGDLIQWFGRGVVKGKKYMVVWCDTYDHSDYPSYHDDADAALLDMRNPNSMAKVIECYDLEADMMTQMNITRCWALRP